jgi:hypothetical protein
MMMMIKDEGGYYSLGKNWAPNRVRIGKFYIANELRH